MRKPSAAQHYEPNREKTQSDFPGKRASATLNSIRPPKNKRFSQATLSGLESSNACEATGHAVNFRQHFVKKFVGR